MPTSLDKFQSLLRELFQFEHADLDFGVYRVMNLRRGQMEKWLNEELPARTRAIITEGGNTADDDLGSRIEAVKAQLLDIDPGGIDADGNIVNAALEGIAKGKEYLKLKAQDERAPARTAANMEPLVYNYLYDFFSRYYDTGDFIPKRRRSFAPDGRDTYAIPWDGEETVLHWANKDQYYIKTGERFTHYRWQANSGGRTFTIEFRLTDADLPSNNNKDVKKRFNLLVADRVEWLEDSATLVLPFHYRGLTPEEEKQVTGTQEARLRESIIKRTVNTVRELPLLSSVQPLATALMAPKLDAAGQVKCDKNGDPVALLPHHLNRWAVKNESDFFIHKDLRRFLIGELDYFLKSVVLNLDNLLAAGESRGESNFRLLGAVKSLGTEIVEFVSQLEGFQKSLFEKKKFVLETSWCFTLDRIPPTVKEEFYAAILASDRQWAEWESLYKFSKWPAELSSLALRTSEFLEANPYLMLDTGLKNADQSSVYDESLLDRLLGATIELDGQTNGVLLHSDNFHALSFLQPAYRNSVETVYIDPPYNTDASPIVYKNGYRRSSWIALLANRLELDSVLRVHPSVRCIAIDDFEYPDLQLLLGGNSSEMHHGSAAVRSKPQGRPTASGFSANHEYAVFWGDTDAKIGRLPRTGSKAQRYPLSDAKGIYAWANFRKSGTDSNRSDRRKSFYPVLVAGNSVRIPKLKWNEEEESWDLDEKLRTGEVAVFPTDSDGTEKVWTCSHETAQIELDDMRVEVDAQSRIEISKKYRPNQEGALPGTWWGDAAYSASESGTKLLKDMFGAKDFDFPKSINLVVDCLRVCGVTSQGTVLDYFGGSGTTGHAVINLNREDNGDRKYILVEMGDYFDTVLKPRLQKAVFSEEWKAGAPVRQANPVVPTNPFNGMSHCIKVLRLESYEDALDNIEFATAAAPGVEFGLNFQSDYELRYALNWESKDCPTNLAVDHLETPFDYTLTLRRETGTVTVRPDLPETFACLVGLHTRRRFRIERGGVSYLIYTGTLNEEGTEVAILWRRCKGWTETDLKAEMDWWRDEGDTLAPGVTRVYVNGACAIKGHYSLDAEFKIRMQGGQT